MLSLKERQKSSLVAHDQTKCICIRNSFFISWSSLFMVLIAWVFSRLLCNMN